MSAYYQPENLDQAVSWLADQQGQIVAGCTDVFAMTAAPELAGAVLDITGIPEICGIQRLKNGWRIGAATPWATVRDMDLPAVFDGLKQAAAEVGSAQIQTAATVGGNLCNASPAADGVPALLTLDAVVELVSTQGLRKIPLAEFILGPRKTTLQSGEILAAVFIPHLEGQGAFVKLGARKYLVISIAMAAARVHVVEGKIAQVALAIGSCGPVATRLARLESALIGSAAENAVDLVDLDQISADISPIEDIRADEGYRQVAAVEMVKQALQKAVGA